MENKKYEFTGEEKEFNGVKLKRIRRISDGLIGGWIEKEGNLSHFNNCFVYNNAKVYGDAKVCGNAKVCDNAEVYRKAEVFDNAEVCCNAKVYGNVEVFGNAEVFGDAKVYDNAKVCGNAKVCDNAEVCCNMKIRFGVCKYNLSLNLKESIRCQTGLGVFNNKVIAYKQVRKDLRSFYDANFEYKVGEIIEVCNADMLSEPCSSGLHFSNMNYWNLQEDIDHSSFLMAEIDLEDVITVQEGKIRCKKAKILGVYNIGE